VTADSAPFADARLPEQPTAIAPDGSEVRFLLALPGGSMAHFRLAPGRTSKAVRHRTVDEIWFFLDGRGEFWRNDGRRETVIEVAAGVCLTIPVGTAFQFRSIGPGPLAAVAITMPPWPGDEEAESVPGRPSW
jgi:mannose-6-phosphate isomerase-like protein (cupin superfamily)